MSKKKKSAIFMVLAELALIVFLVTLSAVSGQWSPMTFIVLGFLLLVLIKYLREVLK